MITNKTPVSELPNDLYYSLIDREGKVLIESETDLGVIAKFLNINTSIKDNISLLMSSINFENKQNLKYINDYAIIRHMIRV